MVAQSGGEVNRLPDWRQGPKIPRSRSEESLQGRVVRVRILQIRGVAHAAQDRVLAAFDPLHHVEPPRPQRREMQAVDEAGTALLLQAVEGARLYMPVLLADITCR